MHPCIVRDHISFYSPFQRSRARVMRSYLQLWRTPAGSVRAASQIHGEISARGIDNVFAGIVRRVYKFLRDMNLKYGYLLSIFIIINFVTTLLITWPLRELKNIAVYLIFIYSLHINLLCLDYFFEKFKISISSPRTRRRTRHHFPRSCWSLLQIGPVRDCRLRRRSADTYFLRKSDTCRKYFPPLSCCCPS